MFYVCLLRYYLYSFRTSLKGKCRPLLMHMLWPKRDSIGGGVLLKDFLKMAMEITLCSLKEKCLVIFRYLFAYNFFLKHRALFIV